MPDIAPSSINPTSHGRKNVAGDTGGGHYGHPLENDPRGHFCGQIDLQPKKYVKIGLEVATKNQNVKGVTKKRKKTKKNQKFF